MQDYALVNPLMAYQRNRPAQIMRYKSDSRVDLQRGGLIAFGKPPKKAGA
jgi:hypothetical protein